MDLIKRLLLKLPPNRIRKILLPQYPPHKKVFVVVTDSLESFWAYAEGYPYVIRKVKSWRQFETRESVFVYCNNQEKETALILAGYNVVGVLIYKCRSIDDFVLHYLQSRIRISKEKEYIK